MQAVFGWMEKLSSWCSEMKNYYMFIPKNKLLVLVPQRQITDSYSLGHSGVDFLCGQLLVCTAIYWLNAQYSIHNHSKNHTLSLYSMEKIQFLVCSAGHESIFFKVDRSYWTCSQICGFAQNLYGNVPFLSNILLWRKLKWNFSWGFINLFTNKRQLVSRHTWEVSSPETGISPASSSLNCWAIDYYKVSSSFFCFVFLQTFGSSSFHFDAK